MKLVSEVVPRNAHVVIKHGLLPSTGLAQLSTSAKGLGGFLQEKTLDERGCIVDKSANFQSFYLMIKI